MAVLDKQCMSIEKLLPWDLRYVLEEASRIEGICLEEVRFRIGRNPSVVSNSKEIILCGKKTRVIKKEQLYSLLEMVSQASVHTVLEQVRNGFLTVKGGHRLGICGSTVVKDGKVENIKHISSVSLRVAREKKGIGAEVLTKLMTQGTLGNTLILSPPGQGKTTLLRDLVRCLSDGIGVDKHRVGLVDERGEVAAMWEGWPQLDVGGCTDIMSNCGKGVGMMMLLRGMNPEILAIDEISDSADIDGLYQCVGCGVKILATAHGQRVSDLYMRPVYREMMAQNIFENVVTIEVVEGRRMYQVHPIVQGECQ